MKRASGDAPKLLKYCEVVRDLSQKSADWLFYDKQFPYLRQSAPQSYPWEQIHWELWLQAMTNSRSRPQFCPLRKGSTLGLVFVPPPTIFQKGHAGHFMPEGSVKGATTSMSALNARPDTLPVNVRSPQPSSALMLANSDRQLLLRVLGSQPVMPVKVDRLESLLAGYSLPFKTFLVDSFRSGFRISYIGEYSHFESPNLQSVLHSPDVAFVKLKKEIDAGRVVGPFNAPPFPIFRTSNIGIIPKKTPNEFRLIHHLSYPKGSSVNDFIPDESSSVRYATINDAILILKTLGKGCFMAKTDIKSAFRIIPVHPLEYPLLCIKWDNEYY